MSEDWKAFQNDPRTVCKYGKNCYQKNPLHHQNFKHPPKNIKRKVANAEPSNKKLKPSTSPRKEPVKDEIGKDPSDEHRFDANSSEDDTPSSKITQSLASDGTNVEIKLPEVLTYHDKTNHSLIRKLFLVEMPKDFFEFFKCLEELDSFEKVLSNVNLELVGPYELLMGKLPVLEDRELYLIHWRFFYDPPEFQSVLKKKGKSEYHIGYFRDEPDKPPVFLASCDSSKGCKISPLADNIFGAVYLYLQNEKKSSPFTSMHCQKLMDKVKKWAEDRGYSLEEYNMKKRQTQIQTKSFHGAGIVVPYDKKTELGYRKLVETDGNLKKMFSKLESAKTQHEKDKILSDLQPTITYASIAVDECDFGTGLEAGIALFCSGIPELQPSALSSLQTAYSLLNREAFAKIIQVHLKHRRKGPNMSVLSLSEK